ncbi:MAG: carboxypeptidase regulatory-like domain-containing protein, partial [Runella zeae]
QAETDEGGVFYKNIQTKLIKKVKSDKKGNFCVGLAPGYYSVFVKEDKGLYANLFDDAMNLNPIHISQGKWEKQDLEINYQAVY